MPPHNPPALRILFAGTPDFAAAHLKALLEAGHQVVGVLTQPDRPAGRGKQLQPSPVKQIAEHYQLPVLQPEHLKHPDTPAQLAALQPDVMIVVAYGLIIPQPILDLPTHGCINVHASLLPRWRGAAPIQRALEAGDTETGVGIMQMEAGLDTGPVLLEKRLPILPTDTGGSLHDKLMALGCDALLQALTNLPELISKARVQATTGVTYAHKFDKSAAELDWQLPAEALARKVRAFNPFPVAWTATRAGPLRIWEARTGTGSGAPGTVLAVHKDAVEVACGEGSLRLTRLQLPGKKAMAVADLLRGNPDAFCSGEMIHV